MKKRISSIKRSIVNWQDISKHFLGADLLLGNGFSLNLTGHFKYRSLFRVFLNDCALKDREIFRSFSNNNFESIQETLINTIKVNRLFDIENNKNLYSAIDNLKKGLIKAIRNNHPLNSQIDNTQLIKLSTQLNHFADIFTLNYDLFLYHIILKMKDKSDKENKDAPYSDYFWGEYDEQFREFIDYDYPDRKHIHYLHGALFLFEKSPVTLKLIRANRAKELVTLIGEIINSGTMPLFVSEGKSKEKLKMINHSNYLVFIKEILEKSQNKLVIFGTSLSPQDNHIINAINYRKNKRELAISIHTSDKTKKALDEETNRLSKKFKSHKIVYFDSSTIFEF